MLKKKKTYPKYIDNMKPNLFFVFTHYKFFYPMNAIV